MKTLFSILLVALVIGAKAQDFGGRVSPLLLSRTQMQAVKVETTIDEKFRVVQVYLDEAKKQVKNILAAEALSGSKKNKEITQQLLLDLQAVMKLNRTKFMDAKFDTIKVDSLQTVQQKANFTTEINRLKAEITAGEDSTYLQPKINELTNKRNDLNKIMKTWTVIRKN